jgi:DNA-binding CsgD family transcriptional regulator
MKVARLSALSTGRLYPPENIPGTHLCQRLSRPQGHSAAERIISMKNTSVTIGNRSRDLPVCSAVPQPTAPPLYKLLQHRKRINTHLTNVKHKLKCRSCDKVYFGQIGMLLQTKFKDHQAK